VDLHRNIQQKLKGIALEELFECLSAGLFIILSNITQARVLNLISAVIWQEGNITGLIVTINVVLTNLSVCFNRTRSFNPLGTDWAVPPKMTHFYKCVLILKTIHDGEVQSFLASSSDTAENSYNLPSLYTHFLVVQYHYVKCQ